MSIQAGGEKILRAKRKNKQDGGATTVVANKNYMSIMEDPEGRPIVSVCR